VIDGEFKGFKKFSMYELQLTDHQINCYLVNRLILHESDFGEPFLR